MVEKLKKGQCKEDRTKRLLLRHRFETRRCRVGLTNGAFHQSNAVTTLWPRGGDSAHQAQSRSGRLGSTPIPRWRRWPISARPRLRRDRTDSNMAAGCTCCFFCPLGASKDVCVCVCVCVLASLPMAVLAPLSPVHFSVESGESKRTVRRDSGETTKRQQKAAISPLQRPRSALSAVQSVPMCPC